VSLNLSSGRTEANVDARRVVRNGLSLRGGKVSGDEEILIELLDLHAPPWPWLMLHRNGY
jgi:hypothetical protein